MQETGGEAQMADSIAETLACFWISIDMRHLNLSVRTVKGV